MPNKSGDIFKCNHCGFKGRCYGTLVGFTVSVPWCSRCNRNDCLVPLSNNPSPAEIKTGTCPTCNSELSKLLTDEEVIYTCFSYTCISLG